VIGGAVLLAACFLYGCNDDNGDHDNPVTVCDGTFLSRVRCQPPDNKPCACFQVKKTCEGEIVEVIGECVTFHDRIPNREPQPCPDRERFIDCKDLP